MKKLLLIILCYASLMQAANNPQLPVTNLTDTPITFVFIQQEKGNTIRLEPHKEIQVPFSINTPAEIMILHENAKGKKNIDRYKATPTNREAQLVIYRNQKCSILLRYTIESWKKVEHIEGSTVDE